MPRKLIKKYMPGIQQIKKTAGIPRVLANHMHHPSLWHFNRRSVAKAVAIGLFCTWLPIPFQTILAALLAIVLYANLPLSVILVFISNPLTMPAMFYFAYQVGCTLLGIDRHHLEFTMTVEWVSQIIKYSWKPLLTGSLVLAISSSLFSYVLVRGLWRLAIVLRWRRRY